MKRLVSPLLLLFIVSTLSLGWRSSPARHAASSSKAVSMMLDRGRLFVSTSAGLHVYDVSNPSAPLPLTFIPLTYNRGSAIKDDIIYTNDAGQLVVLRLKDDSYTIVARIGTKSHEVPAPGIDENVSYFSCMCSTHDSAILAPVPTSASSYATFAVVGNELYRVDQGTLVVYDLANAEKPNQVSEVSVGWAIETIQPTPDLLFLGSRQGMYIFDRSTPRKPTLLSSIEHARACDPVVVSGSTAYVTMRGGTPCGTAKDELMCVNIADPKHPVVLGEKLLTTPYGLAVKNALLYVSHGENGYSLLDVTNPQDPSIKRTWTGEPTRDFIWSEKTLFVLNDHNVSIYDVTNPMAPVLRSRVQNDASL